MMLASAAKSLEGSQMTLDHHKTCLRKELKKYNDASTTFGSPFASPSLSRTLAFQHHSMRKALALHVSQPRQQRDIQER